MSAGRSELQNNPIQTAEELTALLNNLLENLINNHAEETRDRNKSSDIESSDSEESNENQSYRLELIVPLGKLLEARLDDNIEANNEADDDPFEEKLSDILLSPHYKNIYDAIENNELWQILAEFVAENYLKIYPSLNDITHKTNFYNGENDTLSYPDLIVLGLMKKRSQTKVVNLEGNGEYPLNRHNKFENIFRQFTSRKDPELKGLLLALRMIQPNELDLSNISIISSIDDSGQSPICQAIEIAKPSRLRFKNTAISSQTHSYDQIKDKLKSLAKSMELSNIRDLDLSWRSLGTDLNDRNILNILCPASVSQLDLGYNYLGYSEADDWSNLCKLINNNKITHLSLAGNFLSNLLVDIHTRNSEEAFTSFLDIFKSPSLEYLDLSQNNLHQLTDAHFEALIRALEASNITHLVLHSAPTNSIQCNLDTHIVKHEVLWGTTTFRFGANTLGDRGKVTNYTCGENKFSQEQIGRINSVLRKQRVNHLSLKELVALSLWQQPGAELCKETDNSMSFKSDLQKKRNLPSDLADYANEKRGIFGRS